MFAFVNFKEILWYSVTKPVWNYYEPKLRWELELSWSFCYEWKFHCEVDLTTWESKVSCNLTFRYTRSFKNVFAIIAPPPSKKKERKKEILHTQTHLTCRCCAKKSWTDTRQIGIHLLCDTPVACVYHYSHTNRFVMILYLCHPCDTRTLWGTL